MVGPKWGWRIPWGWRVGVDVVDHTGSATAGPATKRDAGGGDGGGGRDGDGGRRGGGGGDGRI